MLQRSKARELGLLRCEALARPRTRGDDWQPPLGYGDHWVTYARIGKHHYAIDGGALEYLESKQVVGHKLRFLSEVFISSSLRGLQSMLSAHYGGERWDLRSLDGE